MGSPGPEAAATERAIDEPAEKPAKTILLGSILNSLARERTRRMARLPSATRAASVLFAT